jgi:hypothetical protein
MKKKLGKGMSFSTSPEMYEQLQEASEKREVPISQLLRSLVRDFLKSEASTEAKSKGDVTR